MYRNRLKKLKYAMRRNDIHAALVSSASDISYLTGFYSEKALLLIVEGGKAVFLIDKMNYELALKNTKASGVEVEAGDKIFILLQYVKGYKIKTLHLDREDIVLSFYLALKGRIKAVKLAGFNGLVRGVRSIKDEYEVEALRKAAKDTVRIWRTVKKNLSPGMSENDVAVLIDVAIRERGYFNSFTTISAIDENSSDPHAIPGKKKLNKSSHLLVDFGLRGQGYCSDLTRVWAKGRMRREIAGLDSAVRTAQDRAIKTLRPGLSAGVLAKKINKYFIDNNLGKYIRHSLGHGVGIDVHEAPFVGEVSGDILKKNMVITIEPGLYIPGVGGIRVEDMFLITSKGCEVLTV